MLYPSTVSVDLTYNVATFSLSKSDENIVPYLA